MGIVCVCMSPALDATVSLAAWPTDGSIAKNAEEVENVGGKGINVARWLAGRGCPVACGGLLGEDNAAPFERALAAYGIADRFARVPGATRRNEMFVTPQGSFKVNRGAFPGLDAANLRFSIADLGVGRGDVVVLSGSLPKCCGADFYARATRELKARGATVVLDASGEPLRRAVMGDDAAARPDVIKPNAEECEPLVGFVPGTPEEFRRATALLHERVPGVIISDGAAGCWFNGVFVAAPKVDVLDTTAAGDTLLAEWCYRTFVVGTRGDEREAARWAVAAGSAACTMPGGDPPPHELVRRLHDSIEYSSDGGIK
ncbi:MAG: 1-phosphofructokinase family hexose kinase [Kiritimatiellia bacterium]